MGKTENQDLGTSISVTSQRWFPWLRRVLGFDMDREERAPLLPTTRDGLSETLLEKRSDSQIAAEPFLFIDFGEVSEQALLVCRPTAGIVVT